MEYKDYYRTLGVGRTATAAEIKKAFRALARASHPDVKPGDHTAERRFKDVSEAYEVLGDATKRKRYDELGADWERYAAAGAGGTGRAEPYAGFPGFGGQGGQRGNGTGGMRYEFRTAGADGRGYEATDFSDFFRIFFGGEAPSAAGGGGGSRQGRSGESRAAAPRTVEAQTAVSLEEAFHGTSRLVEVDGKRLEIQVPRGVDDGSRIRLRGKGGGEGVRARDLVLVTRVPPHAVFARKGADLSRDLEVDLRDVLLGGEVHVPTLSGAVLLTIPAGTQPGRTFRLTGQGMPRLNGEGRGDLRVRIGVRIPTLQSEPDRQAAEIFLNALEHHGAPA